MALIDLDLEMGYEEATATMNSAHLPIPVWSDVRSRRSVLATYHTSNTHTNVSCFHLYITEHSFPCLNHWE